jgi:peroxiredoxin
LVGAWVYRALSETNPPPDALVANMEPLLDDDARSVLAAQSFSAPDFTVYDVDGKEVKLLSFAGKPIVLNFWASWCESCKKEMDTFQKIYEEMGEDVTFVMVDMTDGSRETTEKAKDFIAEKGYTFPVFFDSDQSAADAYSVRSIP